MFTTLHRHFPISALPLIGSPAMFRPDHSFVPVFGPGDESVRELHSAVYEGNLAGVQRCVLTNGVNPNAQLGHSVPLGEYTLFCKPLPGMPSTGLLLSVLPFRGIDHHRSWCSNNARLTLLKPCTASPLVSCFRRSIPGILCEQVDSMAGLCLFCANTQPL